jgi:hypothetical protein
MFGEQLDMDFSPEQLATLGRAFPPREPRLGQLGASFDPAQDNAQRVRVLDRVASLMRVTHATNGWISTRGLVEQAGIEATRRLRELRAAGWGIEKRRAAAGGWEYRWTGVVATGETEGGA